MASTDPDLAGAAADFKKGGWIVSLLGLAGATVSMLLNEKKKPWVFWFKRIVAGGLTGVIMYFTLHGANIDPLIKAVLMCTCGAVVPELLRRLRGWVNGYEKPRTKKRR